jgi:HNH endonuclease
MSAARCSLRDIMTLPSITEVARYWSNRCLRCDAPVYSCVSCWGNAAPGDDGRRHPDCPHACNDSDHARYRTFCDSGEPECIACEQFLGVIPEVWEDWIEDCHDLSEDRWPYGSGDIRFSGRLLLMFGDEPTIENTAPFCHRCWTYLKPRAVTLEWLCEFRDRKARTLRPDTLGEWLPAMVREFYETLIGAPGKWQALLDDPAQRAEWKRVVDLMMYAYHIRLRQPYPKVPAPSRYISDPVKEEVFERDGGQCVKCGSTRDLQYDHVIPYSRGGSNTAANIQLLCGDCNRAKSNTFVS